MFVRLIASAMMVRWLHVGYTDWIELAVGLQLFLCFNAFYECKKKVGKLVQNYDHTVDAGEFLLVVGVEHFYL